VLHRLVSSQHDQAEHVDDDTDSTQWKQYVDRDVELKRLVRPGCVIADCQIDQQQSEQCHVSFDSVDCKRLSQTSEALPKK